MTSCSIRANNVGTNQMLLKRAYMNSQKDDDNQQSLLPKVCRTIHDCHIGSYCEKLDRSEHSVCLPLTHIKDNDWRYNSSHIDSKRLKICDTSSECPSPLSECRGFKDVAQTKICISQALGLKNRSPIAMADTSNIIDDKITLKTK